MQLRPTPLVVASLLVGLMPAAAHAATFNVNSTADATDATPGNGACATSAGVCTLRAAIVEANQLPGGDTINVPANTYNAPTVLTINTIMTIQGEGAATTILKGNGSQTVLAISGAGQVEVRDLTVSGGRRGVDAASTEVTLRRVVIRDNTMVSASYAVGAGLNITSGAKVYMRQSAVVNNTSRSTDSEAQAGGVFINSGVFDAEASTIAGNLATALSSSISSKAFGGGMNVNGGTIRLDHVTLAGNTASAGSGAAYGGNLHVQTASVAVVNTIIANGTALSAYANCSGVKPTPTGRNIDSGTTCSLGAGQLSSTNPLLSAVGEYGGSTQSAPPAATSPAVGQATSCPSGGVDQRGGAAPAGSACDIGAVELGADLATTIAASRTIAAPGADVTYVLRVTNKGPDAAASVAVDVSTSGATQIVGITPSAGSCPTSTRCELGTLANGSTVTISVVVQSGNGPSTTVTGTASTSTPEPAGASNSASASTTIATSAPTGPGSGSGVAEPVVIAPPVLGRRPTVGMSLTTTRGTWTPASAPTRVVWQRCASAAPRSCTPISGATSPTYRPTNGDAGFRLRSVATATATNMANPSTISDAVQQHLIAPVISTRKPGVGDVLRLTAGRWARGTTTHAYKWRRCTVKLTRCATIPGARTRTYRAVRADVGKRLSVLIATRNVAKRTTILVVSTAKPIAR